VLLEKHPINLHAHWQRNQQNKKNFEPYMIFKPDQLMNFHSKPIMNYYSLTIVVRHHFSLVFIPLFSLLSDETWWKAELGGKTGE
jgi:hypothetical protein